MERQGMSRRREPIITIRHPLWTTSAPREDMPVMIFTPAQWALIQSEKMSAGAANSAKHTWAKFKICHRFARPL